MLVELKLSGSDAIRNAFRDMGAELDKLEKKLDGVSGKFGTVASAASNFQTAASGSGSASSVGASSGLPPISGTGGAPPVNAAMKSFTSAALAGNALGYVRSALSVLPPVVQATAAAVIALGTASLEAAKQIKEYADFAFNARGGAASAGELAGLSKAAGVDLSEAAGLASNRAGGSRQLVSEIDQLRRIQNEELAARYAQARGIGGYRSVRNLTDEQYEAAKNVPGASKGQQVTVDRAMANFNMEAEKLSRTLQTFLVPVFDELATEAARLFKILNFQIESTPIYQFLKWVEGLVGGQSTAGDKMGKAADKMDQAANKIRDGIYGGGPRTKGAVPAAVNWYTDRSAINNAARNMGSLV